MRAIGRRWRVVRALVLGGAVALAVGIVVFGDGRPRGPRVPSQAVP